MILGSVCYGMLLAVGVACLKALRPLPRRAGFWCQRRVLMLHVNFMLILNTALQVKNCRENLIAIFETPPERLTYFYLDKLNILVVIVLALTDGLLVWRCYMVQKVLLQGRPARWNNLCWIIPMCLWIAFMGVGITVIISFHPDRPLAENAEPLTLIFLLLAMLCNILLNLFASGNIIIRLLIHRRTMIKSFGETSALSRVHSRIVGIILESAAINIPIAIASATCSWIVGGFGLLAWQVGVPAQSLSSVLVIYQVAKGRAVGSERVSKGGQSLQLDTLVLTQEGV